MEAVMDPDSMRDQKIEELMQKSMQSGQIAMPGN
jgi:hypothetical protein